MLKTNDFDVAALTYDNSFTYSGIGKLQREQVYRYAHPYTSSIVNKKVLEVNCGTGEDALWLANQGHTVLATDISAKMLEKAKDKNQALDMVSFAQLDVSKIEQAYFDNNFDLVFSNFGGLNCIDAKDLGRFIKTTASILNKGGRLIMVLMPKKTIWERFYFSLKGNFKEAFRRNTYSSVPANVDGTTVYTWYYNPSDIVKITSEQFNTELIRPIGFMVPPSYLQPFFTNKKRILGFLGWMDKKLTYFRGLSAYADHFIIVLKKK